MISRIQITLSLLLFAISHMAVGQSIGINNNGNQPDGSALLDLQSTEKGLLIPRMTSAQRAAIPSPATGLLVFDTDTRTFWVYASSLWSNLSALKYITDADGDTKIQVEESFDEDIIRFDVQGNEVMKLHRNNEGAVCLELTDSARSTIIGMEAGASNTSSLGIGGDENSFIGYRAGYANTSGRFNTFLGSQAGRNNTTGDQNTATGFLSLYSNATGDQNTAIGVQSLYSNSAGFSNTANGFQALYANSIGDRNAAFGYLALQSNISGHENTAIGSNALGANTTGTRNTATGYQAMYLNTEGFQNAAHGGLALYFNTAGIRNTANGYQALYTNTTGSSNTANGYQALYANTIGISNTAMGFQAMRQNTQGTLNSSLGYQALFANTTGQSNTAIGHTALNANTTANFNTGVGYRALRFINTQEYNTAIGVYAGDNFTFEASTFLGSGAYPNGNGYTNCMGLGHNARPSASNQVRIGNSQVTSIGGYADWTNISDSRFKSGLQDDVPGLAFIENLRPVTYHLDVHALAAALGEDTSTDADGNRIRVEPGIETVNSRNDKSTIRYSGFIAQEVEAAAASLGYDFSGIDTPDNEDDFYGLRYATFVVPLVKAVQELNEKLKSDVAELKHENDTLVQRIEKLEALLGVK